MEGEAVEVKKRNKRGRGTTEVRGERGQEYSMEGGREGEGEGKYRSTEEKEKYKYTRWKRQYKGKEREKVLGS